MRPPAATCEPSGEWPVRADADLVDHAGHCQMCTQAADLAAAFEADVAAAHAEAAGRLADGRLVWWQAQLRAREEARRAAVQPIVAAAMLAVIAGTGAAAGLFRQAGGLFSDWIDRGAALAGGVAVAAGDGLSGWPSSVTALAANHSTIVLAVLSVVCLAPVVFYAALREE